MQIAKGNGLLQGDTEGAGRAINVCLAKPDGRMRNRIDIDHAHSRAIVREIGERLRGFLTEEAELPTSIGRRMALLRELDGESPSIPTAEENLENKADRKDQRSDQRHAWRWRKG